MVLASGTRASLIYWRERVRGVKPAGLNTPATTISAAVGAATEGTFTRASGSWEDDGYTPGQWIQVSGYTVGPSVNNGNWKIKSVDSATQITVYDENDTIIVGTGGTVQILAQTLRATKRNINPERALLESEEVDVSGLETDVRHGAQSISGEFGYEFSLQAFDDFLEASFRSNFYTFSWVAGGATVASAAGGAARATFTRSGGSWINDGFRVNDFVSITGYSDAAGGNGRHRIITLTDTLMTVYDPLDVITGEASTGSEEFALTGKRLDVGTTMHTFGVERRFEDISQYQEFGGVTVNSTPLNITPEGMVGGSFQLLGMNGGAFTSSTGVGLTPIAAPTNSPFAAFDGAVWEGGLVVGVVTGLSVTGNNNRTLDSIIGSRFSPDVFEGTNKNEGTISLFFEDAVMANKFANETESSISIDLDDADDPTNSFMNLVTPRVKYTGAPIDPEQQGPIKLEMSYKGLKSGQNSPGSTTIFTNTWLQVSNSIYTS